MELALGTGFIVFFVILGIAMFALNIFYVVKSITTKDTEHNVGWIVLGFFVGGWLWIVLYVIMVSKNKDRAIASKQSSPPPSTPDQPVY